MPGPKAGRVYYSRDAEVSIPLQSHAIMKNIHFLVLFAFLINAPRGLCAVEQWGMFEATFESASSAEHPWLDTTFSAVFTQGDRAIDVPGFWDGGHTFRVRFSPPAIGAWEFTTRSSDPVLDQKSGRFTAVAPASGNHGPVEVFDTFYLRHMDGTPYHQFGTTCYAWIHQPEGLQEQTLKSLAGAPFNKIRFCIFPKSYAYNQNEPELFAFSKKPDGGFDFDKPDPAFWHHLERRILDLQQLGIEADLILWHPYDRWGFADMSDAQDDAYLRYAIARLSPFRNVWWSLANEFDFMTNRPRGHRGNKQMDDWDRFFAILQKEDPHQRLRGIHNGGIIYDHTQTWVTHASLQSSNMNGATRYREQYQKPVIYDECRYEGDVPHGWGNLTPMEMTQRFWLGTLAGCYVGHGETYQHPEDILWWSKGGVLHGKSPERIQWLKDIMASAPPFHTLKPLGSVDGRFLLGLPGRFYLLYCLPGSRDTIELPGDMPYKVDLLNPWEMQEYSLGSADPGLFEATAGEQDLVYRFTRYEPGEPRRPDARPAASVTEGIAPLTVQFQSNTDRPANWAFGDGATSDRMAPEHTFDQPGLYMVTMTVTDGDGQQSLGFITIAVDHDVTKPLLRAGFAGEEGHPELTLHGTARLGADGGLLLPAGEPWGRAEAGADTSSALLGGLRSFTITGWLKPDDLSVGSGGNRIVFTLLERNAGIDLVHLADGRMRLSINEWPDNVQNDSSPGRLVSGKWVCFRVSYDATREKDQVCWQFSEPVKEPTPSPKLIQDRCNTYSRDALPPQIGPIAIGNFNSTMSRYGWDRQFRGEIKMLSIHGSRIDGSGAMLMEDE